MDCRFIFCITRPLALYKFVLYCTVLYCTVLYCTVLYCTVPYRTVLYCTVPCCTVLYRAVLITPCHLCLVLCDCVVSSTQCVQLTECFLPITAAALQFLNLTFVFVSAFVCACDATTVYSVFMCVFDPGLCCLSYKGLIGFGFIIWILSNSQKSVFTFVAWNSCFAGLKCNTSTE